MKKNLTNPMFCDIFYKTILTEKTTNLELQQKCITFLAPEWATKVLIKNAVESLLSVSVKSVRVLRTPHKMKLIRGRLAEKKASYKKVYVTVDSLDRAGEIFQNEN